MSETMTTIAADIVNRLIGLAQSETTNEEECFVETLMTLAGMAVAAGGDEFSSLSDEDREDLAAGRISDELRRAVKADLQVKAFAVETMAFDELLNAVGLPHLCDQGSIYVRVGANEFRRLPMRVSSQYYEPDRYGFSDAPAPMSGAALRALFDEDRILQDALIEGSWPQSLVPRSEPPSIGPIGPPTSHDHSSCCGLKGVPTLSINQQGHWSAAARKVLRERYLWKKDGQIVEDEDGMCRRVAHAVAEGERQYADAKDVRLADTRAVDAENRFFDLMTSHKFMPNSPTLMNAGKGNGQQLSACYVLPVGDSIPEIFDALKYTATVHKSGGGTGFSFSRLRPSGSTVNTSSGVASGPVSFMRIFNEATEQIKQGGTRRGANMGILRVDHPDILEFIDCKRDGTVTNFNISVAATDAFMQAVADGTDYDLIDPRGGSVTRRLSAKVVFDRMIDAAWASGDPGVVFIDRINAGPANPTPEVGMVEATNPCGEQPLLPYEACNLGSLNLAAFLSSDGDDLDWPEMGRGGRSAVRFLDDVIQINPYPLPEIVDMVHANRRIGLGVMGWADLLFKMGIPYNSELALSMANEVMVFINRIGHAESEALATERGPFPNWNRSIYKDGAPIRNATVTTIAPTGTISIIADCSSGIEPIFALAFMHKAKGADNKSRDLRFVNPLFEETARNRGFYSDELMEKVLRTGSVRDLDEVPEDVRRVFVTSHEIEPEWHVRMQAAFQKHTDNAVSKTINVPKNASHDDVSASYRLAYELGCNGITVFRDGSKGEQILNVGVTATAASVSDPVSAPVVGPAIKPRPPVVRGYTRQVKAPEGTVNVTINSDADGPLELFVNVGKAGNDVAALAEAIGRLISLNLRLASPMSQSERAREVVSQLRFIGGSRVIGFGVDQVRSL
ncbi:MAG: vitamin B12-dependent ribonucleotide reductase, partial [Chloroflexota bacterium]